MEVASHNYVVVDQDSAVDDLISLYTDIYKTKNRVVLSLNDNNEFVLEDLAQVKGFNFYDPTPIRVHVPLKVVKQKVKADAAKAETSKVKS